VEVRISKQPEVEPGFEDLNDEATDAEESLVLAAREFSEAKVFVLEWHPIFMEESEEERVGAESELRLE
jgi:hypothetical protein